MNCASLTELLDEQGTGWLADPALAAAAASHCNACADCRSAVAGMRALAGDVVPAPAPGGERIARLARLSRPRQRRRILAAAAIVCGGVAFAGAGWYLIGADDAGNTPLVAADREPARVGTDSVAGGTDAAGQMTRFVAAEEARALEAWSASMLGALPDGEYFGLLRVPPAYPPAAAARRLEGEVITEFTITATGDVEDVTIVESSDPIFDAPTIDATSRQKYRPRVVDGRGVAVTGVRNVVRYRLADPAPAEDPVSAPVQDPAPTATGDERAATTTTSDLDTTQFAAELERANSCLEAGDLQCVELELDRIMATYRLSPTQTSRLWHFYGFLHHRRGRYERAIDAYRNAARHAATEPTYMNVFPLHIIAYIHYELGRYQEAMNAAAAYVRLSPNPQAVDYVFIDRLRSLGAVEPRAPAGPAEP